MDANGSDYTLTYTVSGVTTADNPTLAACDNNGTGGVGVVTLTVPTAIPSNATVVITAKDGTDGNTVANTANPPQYQPVGDAVQTTT